jgi:peptidoglycan/xylan/chitin deacetylase (PgdA/CDA1 family)
MTTGLASLSLDLDNLWSYMKTHGDAGWESYPTYLPWLVPRILEFLAARKLRITFFVVGTDAERRENREALAAIAAAGHEIANHSHRHEPWLHLYGRRELAEELGRAEEAIGEATGRRTIGFRGPGYSLSPDTLEILVERGYRYDGSTLPTVIGPLARAYYFRTAKLTPEQRAERQMLFGRFSDGLRSLRPYRWQVAGGSILEIPVTTMPLLRVPMHPSYLIYLAGASPALARRYFQAGLRLCALRRIEPSILLHPLDFAGSDDAAALRFFPGMAMPAAAKMELLGEVLDALGRRLRIATMDEHARAIEDAGVLRRVDGARAAPPGGQSLPTAGSAR